MTYATGVAATQNQAAIDFFKLLHGDRPTQLTAITPDRKGLATKTCASEAEIAAFCEQYDGNRNIYYTLNRLRPGTAPSKKPTKADVGWVTALHVDIDPREGETQDEAKERIAKRVANLPPDVPRPTFVVFSGGGIQLIWKLDEPFEIKDAADVTAAEECNNWFAVELEGDTPCINIDRILRVPGTLNIPDETKNKKGRVPKRAELLAYNPDAIHPMSAFKRQALPSAPRDAAVGPAVKIDTANIKRIEDVTALDKWEVPERVRVIIVQGHHPDEPKAGDNTGSGWTYDVCCNLARCKVPDEIIYSIITDPALEISAHTLKQPSVEKYAIRQIERAKAAVEDFEVGGKEGKTVLGTAANIKLAIQRMGVQLSYNEFACHVQIEGLPDFGPVLRDEAVNRLRIQISERFKLKSEKQFFYDVVLDTAWHNKFHPVHDYLDGLVWDGTPRVDNWLHTYGGAEENEYTKAVASLFLLAAVRRVRKPGCKFDEMLVLEAPTGLDKSSALKVLAVKDDWFTDCLPLGRQAKEVMELLHGKWIVECAELEGLTRDKVENVKAFLSRDRDKARAAYGRLAVEEPRQCVFAGTTNSSQYLFDTTGNRRFWPVQITKFDLTALKRDRDQLWAEAAAREAAGASIRLDQKLWVVAGEQQAERLASDPWQEKINELLGDRYGVIRGSDIWLLLDVPPGIMTQTHAARVGGIMRAMGYVRKQKRWDAGGNPVGVYWRGTEGDEHCKMTAHRSPADVRWKVVGGRLPNVVKLRNGTDEEPF